MIICKFANFFAISNKVHIFTHLALASPTYLRIEIYLCEGPTVILPGCLGRQPSCDRQPEKQPSDGYRPKDRQPVVRLLAWLLALSGCWPNSQASSQTDSRAAGLKLHLRGSYSSSNRLGSVVHGLGGRVTGRSGRSRENGMRLAGAECRERFSVLTAWRAHLSYHKPTVRAAVTRP